MALEGIKAGDKFAVRVGYSYCRYETLTADKVTTKWVVSGSRKYRIEDGGLVGEDRRYGTPQRAMPITQEIIDEADAYRLRDWLTNLNKHSLDVHKLRQIEAIVKG